MRPSVRPLAVGLACCLACCLVLELAGCGRDSPAPAKGAPPALVHLVLQTDWYAEPEHGGFYEALVKGYYRDAGLDVEIRQGSPMTHPDQMVATGQADIAIGRSEYVLVDAARGIPLVILGAMMEHDPQAIMVHHESGIRSLKDLDGRTIMAVPGSPFVAIMEQVLHIHVGIIPSDFGMSRFLADPNFVQQCFVTNEPYYVRQHGANVDVLPISDCGFDPYRVWYTRRDFLDQHPDLVRAFGAASVRGWREYIHGDSAPADTLIASLDLKLDPAFMAYSRGAMQSYRLVEGDPQAGDALGRIRRERLATQIKQLGDIGLLDHPLAVDDVWDPRSSPEESGGAGPGK
jgi:NitT/TauT family transport system substrate-binding protein